MVTILRHSIELVKFVACLVHGKYNLRHGCEQMLGSELCQESEAAEQMAVMT